MPIDTPLNPRRMRTHICQLLALGLSFFAASSALAEDVKVAFIGDQGFSPEAQRVLELIRDEGTELLLIQGDLGYDQNSARHWIDNIDDILGEDFPVLMVVGNHENFEWPLYVQWQKKKLERIDEIRCEGDISVKSYCTYKDFGVVQVAPGITEVDGINGSDNYADYINEKLSSDNSTWRFCSWHKNMRNMQVGAKDDATGWGVYQNCLANGGIVVTGHEHSYSRTHLMSDFQNLDVIHTRDDDMEIGPGSSIAVVSGLGGRQVRPQVHGGDWFASIYTSSQNANSGSLFCTFDDDEADCYFKDVAGLVPDTFSLRSKLDGSSEEQERIERAEAEAAEQVAREEREAEERAEAEAAEQAAREEQEAEERAEAEAAEQAAREEREAEERAEAEAAEQAAREEQEAEERAEAEREEREAEERAEAEAAEQAEREEREAEAAEEQEAPQAGEQQADAAEQSPEPTSENNAPEPTQTSDSQTTDGDVNTDENPFDTVPTSVADSQSTPIIGAAPPPPMAAAAPESSGGGLLGWLSLLSLAIVVLMRQQLIKLRMS